MNSGWNLWRRFSEKLPALLRLMDEDDLLYNPRKEEPRIYAPSSYARLKLNGMGDNRLASFHAETLEVEDGTRLGLWVRKPDDDSKPVYVVFHGRHGHWAAATNGSHAAETNGQFHVEEKHYRLAWLNEIARSGAGVVAVHLRHHGLSRGPDTHIGERWFEKDVTALYRYLRQQHIDPQRVIVAGESLGGALASMLAQRMTRDGQPPAVLGLVNSFANMPDATTHLLVRKRVLPVDSPEDILSHRERVRKVMHNQLDVSERIGDLDPARTSLYIANTLCDDRIPFDQHGKLVKAGQDRGLRTEARILEGDCRHDDWERPHTNWRPEKIVADMQKIYSDHCRPATEHRSSVNGNGSARG